jgi:CubicO group peptidase (beta-lactamase class C family)
VLSLSRDDVHTGAILRITSMTRPVTAVATLPLVQEGRLALSEPAVRPVTVRDLLTFRAGFGMILAPPEEYPILAAEQAHYQRQSAQDP